MLFRFRHHARRLADALETIKDTLETTMPYRLAFEYNATADAWAIGVPGQAYRSDWGMTETEIRDNLKEALDIATGRSQEAEEAPRGWKPPTLDPALFV